MMTKLKQTILAFICLLTISGSLTAQSEVIDLWNGKVPGAIRNYKFKQIVDTAVGWVEKKSMDYPTQRIKR